MLDILHDHGHWQRPDGTALHFNDCYTTFTALGISIMLDDLQCFALPGQTPLAHSALRFLYGAAIYLALASLAADFVNHMPIPKSVSKCSMFLSLADCKSYNLKSIK
jgi:hypothetical protein